MSEWVKRRKKGRLLTIHTVDDMSFCCLPFNRLCCLLYCIACFAVTVWWCIKLFLVHRNFTACLVLFEYIYFDLSSRNCVHASAFDMQSYNNNINRKREKEIVKSTRLIIDIILSKTIRPLIQLFVRSFVRYHVPFWNVWHFENRKTRARQHQCHDSHNWITMIVCMTYWRCSVKCTTLNGNEDEERKGEKWYSKHIHQCFRIVSD